MMSNTSNQTSPLLSKFWHDLQVPECHRLFHTHSSYTREVIDYSERRCLGLGLITLFETDPFEALKVIMGVTFCHHSPTYQYNVGCHCT